MHQDTTRRGLLGGIALAPAIIALPALAATSSHFEQLRQEYHHAWQRCEDGGWDDDDPRYLSSYGRLNDIELAFVEDPSRSVNDAKAKLRFMVDLAKFGVVLDGDDAHALVEDAARFLL